MMSVDDYDIFACYQDQWKTKSEKRNAIRQDIISNDRCMENCIKFRINAGNKDATNAQDKAIADVYRNKFIIPLDLEMLDSAAPWPTIPRLDSVMYFRPGSCSGKISFKFSDKKSQLFHLNCP